MRTLKKYGVFIYMLLFVACVPKTLPPELKPSYTRLQVLQRIQELQNTTIGLYDATPRAITKERADLIVKFTIVAADTVAESKDGWQASIKSAWTNLNTQLNVKDKIPPESGLKTIWPLVDAMMGAL